LNDDGTADRERRVGTALLRTSPGALDGACGDAKKQSTLRGVGSLGKVAYVRTQSPSTTSFTCLALMELSCLAVLRPGQR